MLLKSASSCCWSQPVEAEGCSIIPFYAQHHIPDEGRTSNFPFLHVPAASTSRSRQVTDVGCWFLALHASSLQVCIYFVMENILAVGVQTGPLTSDHIGFKNIYIFFPRGCCTNVEPKGSWWQKTNSLIREMGNW